MSAIKRFSLKRKIIAIFSFLIVMPVIASFLFQNAVVLEYLKEKVIENAIGTISYHNNLIEDKMYSLSEMLFYTVRSEEVQNLLRYDNHTPGTIYVMHKKISENIFLDENIYKVDILSLALIKGNTVIYQYKNDLFESNKSVGTEDWYAETIKKKGNTHWEGRKDHTFYGYLNDIKHIITTIDLTRSIYNKYTHDHIGMAYLSVTIDSIFYSDYFKGKMVFFQNINDPEEIYYKNTSMNISMKVMDALKKGSSGEKSGSISMDIDGNKYMIIYTRPNAFGWRVIELADQQNMMSKINSVKKISLALAAITTLLFFFFLFAIINSLVNPILSTLSYINQRNIRNKSRKRRAYFNEIDDINSSIISLIETHEQIQKDFVNINQENKRNKYKKIQMQINPHFLYNTLNSIKILAETNRVQMISLVTTNLVKILSACMDRNGLYVRVADEIDTFRRYTEIQKIVYEESIVFIYAIDPELSEYETPNFILQPIVENSIVHGMDRTKPQHFIKISNYMSDGCLLFEISDTGLGISKEILERINQELDNDDESTHIGIKSVHRRIQMSYGKEYGITIKSKLGLGSTFIIKLPVIRFVG